ASSSPTSRAASEPASAAPQAGEALGLPAGRAALHVDDLAVPDREHLEALPPCAVLPHPRRRADDPVVSDPRELRLDLERSASLLQPEAQDLTGLVGAASGRGALPPQAAVGNAAPLAVVCDQGCERFRVAPVEG